ncbi:MAG: hemolysin D [Pseudopedobacter saltans]|uniref:Hemolysin D n=1 Tax=Pseudopedobacter saltans TaxID=151895 RepID=A0A2W5H3N9_9SPHI|nr:MAG: hemolysin D [Pseudopedobacter saltans]
MANNEKDKESIKLREKRWRIFFNILSLLLILGVILWGVVKFFHLNDELYNDDAQVEAYINPINARIQGYVKEIKFEENGNVKKGDTIVVIDDAEYKIQLEQALANLADVEAGKHVIQTDVASSANTTTISDANLAEMKARLDNQAVNLKRYENLLKDDVVSQYQYDQVKTEYDAMKAKYESLDRQKTGTQLNTESVASKVAVSNASIQRAKAAVDLARLNLSYCYIIAPYDGIMGRRKIADGQLISIGQPVATIVEDNDKWVTVNYTEKQIAKIKVGDIVEMKIDALHGKIFQGKVQSIAGATGSRYSAVPVDNSTGNFVKVEQRIPVKILFTNKNAASDMVLVRAGMNVEVLNK